MPLAIAGTGYGVIGLLVIILLVVLIFYFVRGRNPALSTKSAPCSKSDTCFSGGSRRRPGSDALSFKASSSVPESTSSQPGSSERCRRRRCRARAGVGLTRGLCDLLSAGADRYTTSRRRKPLWWPRRTVGQIVRFV